jgi:hypothetical protein
VLEMVIMVCDKLLDAQNCGLNSSDARPMITSGCVSPSSLLILLLRNPAYSEDEGRHFESAPGCRPQDQPAVRAEPVSLRTQ